MIENLETFIQDQITSFTGKFDVSPNLLILCSQDEYDLREKYAKKIHVRADDFPQVKELFGLPVYIINTSRFFHGLETPIVCLVDKFPEKEKLDFSALMRDMGGNDGKRNSD